MRLDGFCRTRAKLSDIQELFNRIEQLEGALAQSTANKQTPREVSFSPAELTTPATEQDESLQYVTPSSLGGQSSILESTQPPLVSPQPNTQIPNFSFGQIRFSGRHLGQNWYYKGTPLLSEAGQNWISSRTGQDVNLGKFHLFGSQEGLLPSTFSALQLHISSQELWELPDKNVTQKILSNFFSSPSRLAFPILDRILFEDTLETAYEPFDGMPSSPAQVSAIACVHAALSIICQLKQSREVSPSIRSDACAAKAQCMLGHITGDATLVNLQTVLMLVSSASLAQSSWDRDSYHLANASDTYRPMAKCHFFAFNCLPHGLRAWRTHISAFVLHRTTEPPHPNALLAVLRVGQGHLSSFRATTPSHRGLLRPNPTRKLFELLLLLARVG